MVILIVGLRVSACARGVKRFVNGRAGFLQAGWIHRRKAAVEKKQRRALSPLARRTGWISIRTATNSLVQKLDRMFAANLRQRQVLALFANSLRYNGASAAEGRPSVARLASSRQPVTRSRHSAKRYSITSSARASNEGGIARPSAWHSVTFQQL